MAYDISVKIRAYNLYLQGTSFDDISSTLCKEFEISIASTTVRNWADSENWEETRQKIRRNLRESAQDRMVGKMAELATKAETIQESLFNRMINESPKISSAEGAAYAWKTMSEFILKIHSSSQRDTSPLVVVQAMLDIFREIPAVSSAIERNWDRIKQEIQDRIGPTSENKAISDDRPKHT